MADAVTEASQACSKPSRQRLCLPQVTLCCVDTRSPAEAVHALRQSMSRIDFGRVLYLGPAHASSIGLKLEGIELVAIDDITSIEAYSRFMLHGLGPYIETSHVLVVQWDGFVTRAERWQDRFLDCDYIGPPWYYKHRAAAVGNGGFSLRSRRLIDALAQQPYDSSEPEDRVICVHWRERLEREHGIRIAPVELAAEFGIEYGPWRPAFGFHGLHNFAYEMTAQELQEWLQGADDGLIMGKHGRQLVKALMGSGQPELALALMRRRSRRLGWTVDQLKLYLRLRAQQLRSALSARA